MNGAALILGLLEGAAAGELVADGLYDPGVNGAAEGFMLGAWRTCGKVPHIEHSSNYEPKRDISVGRKQSIVIGESIASPHPQAVSAA